MARARVPSHFSSKMWSFESNGVSRLSASIGLITWRYGSNGAIRSTGLRDLEACLQRGHEIPRVVHLDLGDLRQFLALELRHRYWYISTAVTISTLRRRDIR